jgi:hypothetical protein
VRATEDGWGFAPRDSFAGTILADVGLRQAATFRRADLVLVSQPESGRVELDAPARATGRFEQADVNLRTWWGPGGALQARAALSELEEALRR